MTRTLSLLAAVLIVAVVPTDRLETTKLATRTELSDVDYAFVDAVVGEVAPEGDFDFAQMVVRFVSDDAFRFRRDEADFEGGQ